MSTMSKKVTQESDYEVTVDDLVVWKYGFNDRGYDEAKIYTVLMISSNESLGPLCMAHIQIVGRDANGECSAKAIDNTFPSIRVNRKHLQLASPEEIQACARSGSKEFEDFWYEKNKKAEDFSYLKEKVKSGLISDLAAGVLAGTAYAHNENRTIVLDGKLYPDNSDHAHTDIGSAINDYSHPLPEDKTNGGFSTITGTISGKINSLGDSYFVGGTTMQIFPNILPNETTQKRAAEAKDLLKRTGFKNDLNKRRFSLIPVHVLNDVIDVLDQGAQKYGENNHLELENGDRRYFDAMMRHALAWKEGSTHAETGKSHLAHLISYAILLLGRESKLGFQNG